jgi:hypothetical protein
VKKIALVTATLVLVLGPLTAARYFVAPTGSGDGTSWPQAFPDLQRALAVAIAGDEIWVARGTYRPTQSGDRTTSFRIPSGVAVYGGFLGSETQLAQRNWHRNRTVLSGDIGVPDDPGDNSHTIVFFDRAAPTTILDGFVLSDGTAKGFVRGADPIAAGAAIFNSGANGVSAPTIRNCTFYNNHAREGAGIYNYAANGQCTPRIIACAFIANKADFNGGAIFNNGDGGLCNPQIISCHFEGNSAVYGASILNSGSAGVCKPVIEDSVFVANHTDMSGSVVYNEIGGDGEVYATLTACRIGDNHSSVGRDVENNR